MYEPFEAILSVQGQLGWAVLEDQLRQLVPPARDGINRAAEAILDEAKWPSWEEREVAPSDLYVLPPGDSRQLRSLAVEWPRGKVAVSAIAHLVTTALPEDLDEHASRYVPKDSRPGFPETLIVREEHTPQGAYWRLGDGYHRAVVLCIEGRDQITVFAGTQ